MWSILLQRANANKEPFESRLLQQVRTNRCLLPIQPAECDDWTAGRTGYGRSDSDDDFFTSSFHYDLLKWIKFLLTIVRGVFSSITAKAARRSGIHKFRFTVVDTSCQCKHYNPFGSLSRRTPITCHFCYSVSSMPPRLRVTDQPSNFVGLFDLDGLTEEFGDSIFGVPRENSFLETSGCWREVFEEKWLSQFPFRQYQRFQ